MSNPRALGYRMPAEWEPHLGTWLTWPRREGISFPGIFARIPPVFAAMVRALSAGEGVDGPVFVGPLHERGHVQALVVTHAPPMIGDGDDLPAPRGDQAPGVAADVTEPLNGHRGPGERLVPILQGLFERVQHPAPRGLFSTH